VGKNNKVQNIEKGITEKYLILSLLGRDNPCEQTKYPDFLLECFEAGKPKCFCRTALNFIHWVGLPFGVPIFWIQNQYPLAPWDDQEPMNNETKCSLPDQIPFCHQ
jgi:hypothetical protein